MIKHPDSRAGLTLAEVMIAAAVFGFALLGVFSLGRLMHRTAVDNVSDGIALHAVEGMMEQMRAMPYDSAISPESKAPASLTFIRYQAAKSDGTAAQQATQTIPVNATGFTTVEGISLSTTVDKTFAVTSTAPMPLEVRLVLTPYSTNFANGTTVELFYRYRANPTEDYTNRVMRTFLPRFIQ